MASALLPFPLLLFLLRPVYGQQPTRPYDIYNPFGVSTPPPRDQHPGVDDVTVRLQLGDVTGKKVHLSGLPWTPDMDPLEVIPPLREQRDPSHLPPRNNITVFIFLGLPYAMPPTGERRFKPPQQLVSFPGEGAYRAFSWGPSCPQDVEKRPVPVMDYPYPFIVNEDCLYLNIFTPDVSKASGQNYPVIVFFHGGNFQTGSSSEWPAHGLASRGLVVVTVNYRLGPFGFIGLGDENTNFGLLDQRLSLQWVQQHISSFGGDPLAVTLVGHDAGGVSVGLHMLSPLSKGLFRAASSMSGAEVSYHSYIGRESLAINNTLKLGRYLGCVAVHPRNVWDCIKEKGTDDIVRASTDIFIEYNRYLFLPSVDRHLIPFNPLWQLNNVPPPGGAPYPSPVPYLIGMNAQDGSEVVLEDRRLGEFNQWNDVDYQYMRSFVLEYSFRHNYSMNREAVADAIITRYTFWPDAANEWMIREKFVQLATDAFYTAPIALSAHLHSAAGSRTFMYINNYNFSRGFDNLRFLRPWMAVCRECDLYLLFGYAWLPADLRPQQLVNVTFTDTDRNASQVFSSIYRRFAYHQNPSFLYGGDWPPYEPRGHWYMNFNYSRPEDFSIPGTVHRDYRYEDVAFWNEYIPQLVNYMTTTFPPIEVSVRRQLVTSIWIIAIIAIVLMLFIVLAGVLAYKVCEGTHYEEQEVHRLVDVTSGLTSQSSIASSRRKPRPSSPRL